VWFPWLAAVTAASHLDLLSVKKRFNLLLILLTIAFSSKTQAVSFTADAVQLRGSDVSHARMYWSDGNVRFEYLDQGVPMVQIFDTRNRKITWLDTEKKLYVQRDMNQEQMRLGTEQQPTSENPCDNFPGAECTHLKTVELKGRQAEKWLITMDVSGRDMHIFQWLDKQYKIPLRQENPDGTVLDVKLLDNQEFNGRKVRKVDMIVFSPDGSSVHGIQWIDSELGIVVRQQDDDGGIDELRNITVETMHAGLFEVPDGYKTVDSQLTEFKTEQSVNSGSKK
jgi:hypothetical protein